jgi:hypothetical protein
MTTPFETQLRAGSTREFFCDFVRPGAAYSVSLMPRSFTSLAHLAMSVASTRRISSAPPLHSGCARRLEPGANVRHVHSFLMAASIALAVGAAAGAKNPVRVPSAFAADLAKGRGWDRGPAVPAGCLRCRRYRKGKLCQKARIQPESDGQSACQNRDAEPWRIRSPIPRERFIATKIRPPACVARARDVAAPAA